MRPELRKFRKNDLVVDAVVRNLEIVGEAAKHISAAVRKKAPGVDWNKGLRYEGYFNPRLFRG